MSAARTTAKKHSAPSVSATAARLGGYLTVSLGAGVLGTAQADAEIVAIDIGPTGFNIGGPNAGVTTGNFESRYPFPFSYAGYLYLNNKQAFVINGVAVEFIGLYGNFGLAFAGTGQANTTKFTASAAIDGTSTFDASTYGSSGLFSYKPSGHPASVSPDFGPGSYVGFRTSQGNYGWLEVTWSSSSEQFQIYSGAYESVAGVGIKAGDTGAAAVPEIDPNSFGSALSLVMGSLAVLEHRRRKRSESEPAAAVA